MSNNAHSHKLLSVVTTVHHQGVGQSLNDRACCLAKSFLGVTAGGVWDVDRGSDLDVVTAVRKEELAFMFQCGFLLHCLLELLTGRL